MRRFGKSLQLPLWRLQVWQSQQSEVNSNISSHLIQIRFVRCYFSIMSVYQEDCYVCSFRSYTVLYFADQKSVRSSRVAGKNWCVVLLHDCIYWSHTVYLLVSRSPVFCPHIIMVELHNRMLTCRLALQCAVTGKMYPPQMEGR